MQYFHQNNDNERSNCSVTEDFRQNACYSFVLHFVEKYEKQYKDGNGGPKTKPKKGSESEKENEPKATPVKVRVSAVYPNLGVDMLWMNLLIWSAWISILIFDAQRLQCSFALLFLQIIEK